jgi:type I restriction enzyme S subunit
VTDNGFDPKGMNFISPAAHQQMVRSEVKPGDLLMTITGNVGRVAKAPEEFATANINQHIARIRVLGTPEADADYVYHCLKHDGYAAHYRTILTGQAYPQISLQQVRETPVALPPVAERQKIAAILTAVDDKLDVIARQIEATQTLKQGLMQTLFSRGAGAQSASGAWHPHEQFKEGPIGTVPQCWEFCTLGDLAVENITYGVVQPGEAVVDGVPMVRGGDIKDGEIAQNLRTISSKVSSQFKRTILEGGELLVSLVGYPGETAVVPAALKGANIARQAGMIRTGSLALSKYLHCYLASPAGKAELLGGMIGSAQQVINLKSLRDVQVPMPPEAERDQITAVCEATSSKLRALSAKQRSYGLLKRGLMQKLLTGEWRVKVDADIAA